MIWLIGNKGMLGYEVEELLKKNNLSYTASDQEIDITDFSILVQYIKDKKIDWIVNCAAYTAVDKAEKEKEKAYSINRDGVRNITKIASEKQAKLIHISTDYVFDGKKNKQSAYTEGSQTNPMGIYGKSKLAGEKEVINLLYKYFIIRTAWLYGVNGHNFVYTMLRLFREREVITVVDDQWGSPTYAADLAEVILKIIETGSDKFGIYHFTNEGVTNWYEFAIEIYDKAKEIGIVNGSRNVEIKPIKTEKYPTAAIRPQCSTLSKDRIKKEFNLKIRNWYKALEDFLNILSLRPFQ